HRFECCVDLAHPRRVTAVIGMELRRQPTAGHANLFDRRVPPAAENVERGAHAVDGYVVERSSAYRERTPDGSPPGSPTEVQPPRPQRAATSAWVMPAASAAACTHAPVATAWSASATDTGKSHNSVITCRYAA